MEKRLERAIWKQIMIAIFNNEAIGLIAIQSVLSKSNRLNIANAFLLLPLLFDKKIRGYLKRKTTTVLSMQEIATTKNAHFIGFNEKFIGALVVTANAIAMGIELNLLSLDGNDLILVKSAIIDNEPLGKKMEEILGASENVSLLLAEPPEALYALLRIEL
jgi:hypothetical protein